MTRSSVGQDPTRNDIQQPRCLTQRTCRGFGLRVLPITLLAVAALHGQTPTFNLPNVSTVTSSANSPLVGQPGCSGGTVSNTSQASSLINSGGGIMLSGSGVLTHPGGVLSQGSSPDCIVFTWSGTGQGVFQTATLPAGKYNFTISTQNTVQNLSWTLTEIINSVGSGTLGPFSTQTTSSGTGTFTRDPLGLSVPNGQAFTSYQVILVVQASIVGNGAVTVNISDLEVNSAAVTTTTPPPPPPTPAPPSIILGLTGLAGFGLYEAKRRLFRRSQDNV